jgi:hypothetical protein
MVHPHFECNIAGQALSHQPPAGSLAISGAAKIRSTDRADEELLASRNLVPVPRLFCG